MKIKMLFIYRSCYQKNRFGSRIKKDGTPEGIAQIKI
jgi:hypothetical protein